MDPETEEIIKKQVQILPPEARRLLADPGLNDKILNIGKKNGLTEEQLGALQLETNLVLLGLVHPDEYGDALKERLKVSDMKADNIINEMNREILNRIREKLIGMYDEEPETESGWLQNLDFILSGGEYTAPAENEEPVKRETPTPVKNTSLITVAPTLEEIKKKLIIKQ